MPMPPTRVIVLRIDTGADPIAGRLENEDGASREFVGWLGLARSLEVLVSSAPLEGGDEPPPPSRE